MGEWVQLCSGFYPVVELLANADALLEDDTHIKAVLIVDGGKTVEFPLLLLIAASPVMAAAAADHSYQDYVNVHLPDFDVSAVHAMLEFISKGLLPTDSGGLQLLAALGIDAYPEIEESSASMETEEFVVTGDAEEEYVADPRALCVTDESRRPFACDVCGKAFTSRRDVLRHMRTHTGERPFGCDICHKRFGDKSCLARHLKVHARAAPPVVEEPAPLSDADDTRKPFACDTCNKSFYTRSDLTRHIRTHTGEKPYGCDVCQKRFGDKSCLYRHLKLHQARGTVPQGEPEVTEAKKPFVCQFCQKCFKSRSELDRHVRTHTGEKPYSCSVCWKSFGDISCLYRHLRVIHPEQSVGTCASGNNSALRDSSQCPYVCELCGKAFSTMKVLASHHRNQHQHVTHKCHHCGETFVRHNKLVQHLRIHS